MTYLNTTSCTLFFFWFPERRNLRSPILINLFTSIEAFGWKRNFLQLRLLYVRHWWQTHLAHWGICTVPSLTICLEYRLTFPNINTYQWCNSLEKYFHRRINILPLFHAQGMTILNRLRVIIPANVALNGGWDLYAMISRNTRRLEARLLSE